MSGAFLLLAYCGAAFVAVLTSLLVGVSILAAREQLVRLAPAAQARLSLALATAPAFVGLAVQLGCVVSFHYLAPRHAPGVHSCNIPLTPLLLTAGSLLGVRLALALRRAAVGSWRSFTTARALRAAAGTAQEGGFHLCPAVVPQAFVLGLWRPRIFVSRGLLRAMDPTALATILAHEHAHVRRRDPLRRLLASLVLAFHVPGIAGLIESWLARSHELAADAEAADVVGDAPRVAATLVRLARLRLTRAPAAAHTAAIAGGELEARVADLLAPGRRPDAPGLGMLIAGFCGILMLATAFAEPLHRAAEALIVLLR
jgi:Zn-dependent protease with chaperone function